MGFWQKAKHLSDFTWLLPIRMGGYYTRPLGQGHSLTPGDTHEPKTGCCSHILNITVFNCQNVIVLTTRGHHAHTRSEG